MGTNSDTYPAGGAAGPAKAPYRASWVDDLISLISRLPIPAWAFYLCVLAVLMIIVGVALIFEGLPLSAQVVGVYYMLMPIYPVAFMAVIHYADNTAGRSFDVFLPALGASEADAERLRYELTTLPAIPALLAALIGAVFGLLVIGGAGAESAFLAAPVPFIVTTIVAILGFTMTGVVLYHTIRQLRLVSRIHAMAANIDLLHASPLYAFSSLTARTGVFFLLVLWFDLVANPESLVIPGLLALNVMGLGVMAVTCFVLPLQGMHNRLVAEKQRLLWETDHRLAECMGRLYERVDAKEPQDVEPFNKQISSLITTHDFIAKIPTWPWRPETLAFFVSALTFPIIVFLIQTLIKALTGVK